MKCFGICKEKCDKIKRYTRSTVLSVEVCKKLYRTAIDEGCSAFEIAYTPYDDLTVGLSNLVSK